MGIASFSEQEAAVIIQNALKHYLQIRKGGKGVHADNEEGNVDKGDGKIALLEDINELCKRLQNRRKRKEEIRKICDEIDEIGRDLKAVSKLDDCRIFETSFSNYEQVRDKHEEKLKEFNRKWWEKLDFEEDKL